MHPAVELILKRMESNPDEFMKGNTRRFKWEKIIQEFMEYMTDEEKAQVKQKYSELQMEVMHREIMAELLHGDEEDEDPFKPVPHKFTVPFGEPEMVTVSTKDILNAYEEYENEKDDRLDRLCSTLFRSQKENNRDT